jgi:serine/threonine protein phosphatase PrpC
MRPFISDSPDITKHDLQPEDHFVILACDGIWDVTSDRMAVSLCRPHVDESCDFAALKLRDHAYFAGSQDNISVLIFSLKALRAAQLSGTMPKT